MEGNGYENSKKSSITVYTSNSFTTFSDGTFDRND